jgi:hypothetical protein
LTPSILWAATLCVRAEVITFSVDPARSSLVAEAILVPLGRAPLTSQDGPSTASLTASYGGTIEVDLDDPLNPTTIQFLSADAVAQNSGEWLPDLGGGTVGDPGLEGDADPGLPAPASYGFLLDAGPQGTGYFALRDTSISVSSDQMLVTSNEFFSVVDFEVVRGTYAFNVATSLGDDAGTDDVTGEMAENFALSNGTYGVDGFTATLTLPVDALFGEGDDLEVRFVGQMVATAHFGQSLDGDYNNNGVVEQGDLDLVLLHWGEAATPPPGGWVSDLPAGTIDQEELDGVLLNWGNQAPALAPAESVPEPYALLLLLLAPTPLILRRQW